jgi:HEAT repeat protein
VKPVLYATLEAALHDHDATFRRGVLQVAATLARGEQRDVKRLTALLHMALQDADLNVRTLAAVALYRMQIDVLPNYLIAGLQIKDDINLRVELIMMLSKLHTGAALDPLFALLDDRNQFIRERTAATLRDWPDPGVVDRALVLLTADAVEKRQQAISILSGSKDLRVGDAALAAMKDPEPTVRRAAIFLLVPSNDPRMIDPLLAALRDPKAEVIQAAAIALAATTDPRICPALLPMVQDPNDVTSTTVIKTLGALGDPRALPALIDILRHGELPRRQVAATALAGYGNHTFGFSRIPAVEDNHVLLDPDADAAKTLEICCLMSHAFYPDDSKWHIERDDDFQAHYAICSWFNSEGL